MLVYQRVAQNTQDQFNMDLSNSPSSTDIWKTTCPKPSHSTELQRCNLTNVLGILEGKVCLKNHLKFESWLSALQVLSFQEYHWSYSPENKHWNWKSSHGMSKCFTKPSFLCKFKTHKANPRLPYNIPGCYHSTWPIGTMPAVDLLLPYQYWYNCKSQTRVKGSHISVHRGSMYGIFTYMHLNGWFLW